MIKDNEQKLMIEKFDFFYNERVPVHIKKLNGEWLNGNLIDRRSDSVFVIDEKLKGHVTIFVSEVKDVDKLRDIE